MRVRNYLRYASIVVVVLNPFVSSSHADSLLSDGDDAVLAAPVANFRNELRRLRLPPAQFQAVDTQYDGPQTNISIELEDLRTALVKAGKSSNDVAQIAAGHLAQRNKLAEFDDQLQQARQTAASESDENGNVRQVASAGPLFPKIPPGAELPQEFADYLEGTVAWHNPALADKALAREAWERILNRPAKERRFKSTWAAFMLGRSLEDENPPKAIAYFQQVRALAKEGYSDRLGLAAASLGWEARAWLNQSNYERAIDLYLQQMATGDESAPMSLCFTMRQLVSGGTEQFTALAANPRARRVVTAYIVSTKALRISYANSGNSEDGSSNRLFQFVSEWVAANDAAKVNDPELAEELALAAYQNGQWETAARWIARSGASPVAQWLQAKVLFRAHKIAEAGSLLERVAGLFPLVNQDAGEGAPRELKQNLSMSDYYWSDVPRRIRGELAVFHFSRGQYVQALDDFLRADFWQDAAYIADRILTVDELKYYVDRYWPVPAPADELPNPVGARSTASQISDQNREVALPLPKGEGRGEGEGTVRQTIVHDAAEPIQPPIHEENATVSADEVREKIRYLLARRLTRTLRGDEAREYYPAQWQPSFDELVTALRTAWDESLPPEQRVSAFEDAAMKTRSVGMELLGTELAPDWHCYDGNSESELTAQFRATNENFTLMPASPDELSRYAQHRADPEMRFHYRYQAAFLGWEAAKMLPNDSEETARILCLAGSWLKARDPETADLFYKALARRCPNTEIGAEANRIHWFPKVDEDGNLLAPAPEPETVDQPVEDLSVQSASNEKADLVYPTPGHSYVIQVGDTLEDIAHATSEWGETVSVDDIVDANPGLDGTRLRVGQRLLIPTRTEKE